MVRCFLFTRILATGAPAPTAQVTVRVSATQALASIFSDAAGTTLKVNPFAADSNGYAFFYAADDVYDITVSSSITPGVAPITTYTLGAVSLVGPPVLVTTEGAIPATPPAEAGDLALVTTGVRGLRVNTGSQWVPVSPYLDLRLFGAVGDGVTDDTAAILAWYAACKAAKVPGWIPCPSVGYRFTSQLTWDGQVSIYGEDMQQARLLKDGNFVGVVITNGSYELRNFAFKSNGGADVSDMVQLGDAAGGEATYIRMQIWVEGVSAARSGRHGIRICGCYNADFTGCSVFNMAGDGIRLDGSSISAVQVNANTFGNNSLRGNGGYGLHVLGGSNQNGCGGPLIVEQNVSGGVYLEAGVGNEFKMYLEANSNFDLKCDAACVRPFITLLTATSPAFIINNALNALGIDNGVFVAMQAPAFTAVRPGPGQPGNIVTFSGGDAGPDGAGAAGGIGTFKGGDAKGSTAANGARAILRGGSGVAGGSNGITEIDALGAGVVLGSDTLSSASALLDLISTTKGFGNVQMTTAQRLAIASPRNGLQVYDTDLNQLFLRRGGVWVQFTTV